MSFQPLDWLVLALALIGYLTLGFTARLKEASSVQLIAAGRGLTLPLFVATLVTTWYGGILGVGQAFDWYGLSTWLILGVPYYIFGIAFALFLARRVRLADDISLPERMDRVYGRNAALICAVLVLVIGAPSAHIAMLGQMVSDLTGIHLVGATIIGALVGTAFLYRGGLLADARSNTLAFILIYVGFIVMLVVAVRDVGPPGDLVAQLPESHRSWNAGRPDGWFFLFSWILIGAWTFVDPGFHQRVASVRNPELARKGLFICIGCWVVFDLLTVTTALYAYSSLGPGLGMGLFPKFGDSALPPGLKALFFASLVALISSAGAGYTLVSGATLGRDIAGRIWRSAREKSLVLWSRLGIAGATVLGVTLALTIRNVVDIWFYLGSIVVPGLFIPTIGMYAAKKPPKPSVAVATMIAGSGTALAWFMLLQFGAIRVPWAAELSPIYPGLAAALITFALGSVLQYGGGKVR